MPDFREDHDWVFHVFGIDGTAVALVVRIFDDNQAGHRKMNVVRSNNRFDIAEIDFLLRVANERLQLFSDPLAADLALQAADVQIEALDDPMYLSVRQRIASSRQALAAVPRIDRVNCQPVLAICSQNCRTCHLAVKTRSGLSRSSRMTPAGGKVSNIPWHRW